MKKSYLLLLIFLLGIQISIAQNVGIGTNIPTSQLHTTGEVRFEGLTGTGSRVVYAKPDGILFTPTTSSVYDNNNALDIVDNNCSGQPSSDITVTGQPAGISSSAISVTLNITHTYDADLTIFLTAPNGDVLCLAANNGANGDDFFNTIFSDDGLTNINAGTAPFSNVYKPIGSIISICSITATVTSFSEFGSGTIDPNGVWNIKVFDNSSSDVGRLNNWSISFVGTNSFNAVNNYFPKWSNGSLSNTSNLFDNGSFIGLGTTGPASSFHIVQKSPGITPLYKVENISGIITNFSSISQSNASLVIENNMQNTSNVNAGLIAVVKNGAVNSNAIQAIAEAGGKTSFAQFSGAVANSGSAYGVYATASRLLDQNAAYAVYGSGFFGNYAGYFSGNLAYTGTLSNPSDEKLKTNIQVINNNGSVLNKLMQLNPITYDFKKEYITFMSLPSIRQYGFTAQNIESQFPELIIKNHQPGNLDQKTELDKTGLDYKGVNYMQLIPILTQAIKEQQEQINELRAKNEAMQNEINDIKKVSLNK